MLYFLGGCSQSRAESRHDSVLRLIIGVGKLLAGKTAEGLERVGAVHEQGDITSYSSVLRRCTSFPKVEFQGQNGSSNF